MKPRKSRPGWWECPYCACEFFDTKMALGPETDPPPFSECKFCGTKAGRIVGYWLQLGHASPWWIERVPRWMLWGYYGKARDDHDRAMAIIFPSR